MVVIDADGAHSYADVDRVARRLATLLLERRTTKREGARGLDGERVALLVSPGAPFVEAFFGVLLAGGTVVVLSPGFAPATPLRPTATATSGFSAARASTS